MKASAVDVVTGAFSYTGKYIALRLLARGREVRTLTGHPHRPSPLQGRVQALPYAFDNFPALVESLRGADTLYNTYWVRFPRRGVTYERAVENSRTLLRAAEEAGVRRVVHISITHASPDSPLPYFRGKGLVEEAVRSSRLSYAILRPTVLFGHEDVLINNIAWFLRHFPLFALPGRGHYPIRPVFVEDVADLAVEAGVREGNIVVDAVGPETYTFREMVGLIARAVGSRACIISLPPRLAYALVHLLGPLVEDVVLTWEEVRGLMAGLLTSPGPATGRTSFRRWLEENREALGRHYASELARHYR